MLSAIRRRMRVTYPVGRDAAIAGDPGGPGVVAGEGEGHVASEAIEEPAQVLDPAEHILARIHRIAHAHERGRGGHELHQALRTDGRHGQGIESRLGLDHRSYEVRVDAVGGGRLLDERLQLAAVVAGNAEVGSRHFHLRVVFARHEASRVARHDGQSRHHSRPGEAANAVAPSLG